MDKNKRGLSLGLVKKETDPDEELRARSAWRLRRILRTITAIIRLITVALFLILQYYSGLHK